MRVQALIAGHIGDDLSVRLLEIVDRCNAMPAVVVWILLQRLDETAPFAFLRQM